MRSPKDKATEKLVDAFVAQADPVLPVKKRGRGNPRAKVARPLSFSVETKTENAINEIIEYCEDKGMYGVNRSDVLSALVSSVNTKNLDSMDIMVMHIRAVKLDKANR